MTTFAEIERQYFESLDWTKSSTVLAQETGVGYPKINLWRKILRKPKVSKWFPACHSWDWTKSDTELAAEHGLLPSAVHGLRLQVGAAMVPRNSSRPTFNIELQARRQNWEALDWTKTDSTLATETGTTRESVRLWRAKLGKPKSPNKFRFRKFVDFVEHFKGRAELTYREANEALPISHATFRQYCAQLGITTPPRNYSGPTSYPWDKLNWQLPNKVLAEIWRGKSHSVAVHRMNHVRPSPLFRVVNGNVPETFQQMVEAEKRKAEEYFNAERAA